MSIVTLTFHLQNQQGCPLFMANMHVCQILWRSIHETVWTLLCSKDNFKTSLLRPLTSKINRDHPLIMINMSAKFSEDEHNSLVSIVFTRSKLDAHTHMHWLTNHSSITVSPHNALPRDNNSIVTLSSLIPLSCYEPTYLMEVLV